MAKKVLDTTHRNRRTVGFDNGVQLEGSPKGIEAILEVINRMGKVLSKKPKARKGRK